MKHFSRITFLLSIAVILALSYSLIVAHSSETLTSISDDPDRTEVVKIFTENESLRKLSEAGVAVDHVELSRDGSYVIAYLFGFEVDKMKALGVRYETIYNDWYEQVYLKQPPFDNLEIELQKELARQTDNISNFPLGSMGGFYTYDETIHKLDSLRILYPNLLSAKFQIGTTFTGKPIWAYRVTKDPDVTNDRPQVLYTAMIHAREAITIMQMMYFTIYMLENYPDNEVVKFIVENRDMYFIPFVNPDGYRYNQKHRPNGGGMRRKNLRGVDTNIYSPAAGGIDLNRNFGTLQFWNSPNGGSDPSNVNSDTYRGTAPFSEPETQTIQNFVNSKNFKNSLFYHSYSNLYIYPWAWIDPIGTPDSVLFKAIANEMARYNDYRPGTPLQTVGYRVRGSSDDWMYNDSGHAHCIALTPEIGTSSDGFWPNQNRIIPLVMQNLQPNILFAGVADMYVQNRGHELSEGSGLAPGDTASFYIRLKSIGITNASSVTADLTLLDTFVTGISTNKNFGGFGFLEEKTNEADPFKIKVATNILNGSKTDMVLRTKIDNQTISIDTISFILGIPTVLFFDEANSVTPNWTVTNIGPNMWDTTSLQFYSSPTSFTDSRIGNYANNVTNILTMNEQLSLGSLNIAKISFRTKYDIETGWDYGQVQITTNNGSTWTALHGTRTKLGSGSFQPNGQPLYDGIQQDWVEEVLDITQYVNHNVRIRFYFRTDGAVTKDGWYVDDIKVWGYDVTLSVTNEGEIPLQYSLSQNYPNPFNPVTNIKFDIANTGLVELKVYDLLGRDISTLVNEIKSTGSYSVNFNASDLSTGIYIYRLTARDPNGSQINFTETKKMILIK